MNDRLERLWAPWRLDYIKTTVNDPQGCFLCEAAAGDDDRGNLVLHRGGLTLVLLNLYPYNSGHLLVAPQRHLSELEELTPEELVELSELVRRAVSWIRTAYSPDGFNIGLNLGRVAGAGVPGHLHYHVVPRWNGDTNYMAVVGGTKVISEGLESSYDLLKGVVNDAERSSGA